MACIQGGNLHEIEAQLGSHVVVWDTSKHDVSIYASHVRVWLVPNEALRLLDFLLSIEPDVRRVAQGQKSLHR